MSHLIDSEILQYIELMEFESDLTDNKLKTKVESHIKDCRKCRDMLESLEKEMFYSYKYTKDLIDNLSCVKVETEDDESLLDVIYDPKNTVQQAADECISNNQYKDAEFYLKEYFELLALEEDIESEAYLKAYKKYSAYPFFKEHLVKIIQKPYVHTLEQIKKKIEQYFIKIKIVGQNIVTTLEPGHDGINSKRLLLGSTRGGSTQNVHHKGFDMIVNNGRTFIVIDCEEDCMDFELILIDENKNEYKGYRSSEEKKVKFDFGILPSDNKYWIKVKPM